MVHSGSVVVQVLPGKSLVLEETTPVIAGRQNKNARAVQDKSTKEQRSKFVRVDGSEMNDKREYSGMLSKAPKLDRSHLR